MRKIIAALQMSVEGFIEDPNGKLDWIIKDDENVEGHKLIHEMLAKQEQRMTYQSDVARITFLKPDIALAHATLGVARFYPAVRRRVEGLQRNHHDLAGQA